MASVFRDGFDTYNGTGAVTGFISKWSNASSVTLVTGRFGSGQAISFSGSSDCSATFDSAVSSFALHAGFYNDGSTSTTPRPHIHFMSDATYMVGIQINNVGEVIAYRMTGITTGTELGRSASGAVPASAWGSLAIEVVIHDTTGRVTVYWDGTQVLNLTNVDTRNGTPTTVNTIKLGTNSAGGSGADIDDIYITDSATKLSEHPRAEVLYPNSDGATLNWVQSTGANHFGVVDEALASATDYLSASTVGDVDELGLGNLVSTPTTIHEVTVIGYLAKTDATARSVALGVKSGATNSDGSNYSLNSTGLRHERSILLDPDTAAAWTSSGVNALQLRPKVTV